MTVYVCVCIVCMCMYYQANHVICMYMYRSGYVMPPHGVVRGCCPTSKLPVDADSTVYMCVCMWYVYVCVCMCMYHPLSRVVKAKAGSCHIMTWTAWVQFPPFPTHNTCLLCSAMSGLVKLACLFMYVCVCILCMCMYVVCK